MGPSLEAHGFLGVRPERQGRADTPLPAGLAPGGVYAAYKGLDPKTDVQDSGVRGACAWQRSGDGWGGGRSPASATRAPGGTLQFWLVDLLRLGPHKHKKFTREICKIYTGKHRQKTGEGRAKR